MEQLHEVDDLITKAEEYATTSYHLSKLRFIDTGGSVVSTLLAGVLAGAVFVIGLLIIGMGLALVAGQALGRVYYGFFAVGAGFVLLGILFYYFLYSQVKPVVTQLLKNELFN